MYDIVKKVVIIFISFSGGLVISSAVFAFISAIGIIPDLASKTKTTKFVLFYEEMIILGGLFGCLYSFIKYDFAIDNYFLGRVVIILFFTAIGIFVGSLASALAEVINVIPIFSQRTNIKNGIPILMLSMAIGKCVGSLIYFANLSLQNK